MPKRLFLDTAPIIYFIEANPHFLDKVQAIFDQLDRGSAVAVISPITLAECLIVPYRSGKPEMAQSFLELLLDNQSVVFYPADEQVAEQAARLRAAFDLTLLDALQVATALQAGCDLFLTNDRALKRIPEIPVQLVSEL